MILDKRNVNGKAEGKPQDWLDKRIVSHSNENRLDHSIVHGNEARREFATGLFNAMHELFWLLRVDMPLRGDT